jgi:hypothetical protein
MIEYRVKNEWYEEKQEVDGKRILRPVEGLSCLECLSRFLCYCPALQCSCYISVYWGDYVIVTESLPSNNRFAEQLHSNDCCIFANFTVAA